MSNAFWTTVKADASTVEQDVVSGAKTILNYVDNALVTDIIPELQTAFTNALQQFEQSVLAGLLAGLATTPAAPATVDPSTTSTTAA